MGRMGIANGYSAYPLRGYSRAEEKKGKREREEQPQPSEGSREARGDVIALTRKRQEIQAAQEAAAKPASEEDRQLARALVWAAKAVEEQQTEDEQPEDEIQPEEQASESEQQKGRVAFNAAKRARQLAAASSPGQVQTVLSLLNKDLADCKYGLANDMCDQAEVDKVKAMIQKAQQRMSEVSRSGKQEQAEGFDAFAIASLM